jgi:hypothetical protein
MKGLTRKVDVGINFGAGIGYSLRFGTIFIKGRYTLGLTNTVNGGTMDINRKSKQLPGSLRDEDVFKNRGIQVLIGVLFPVGKK